MPDAEFDPTTPPADQPDEGRPASARPSDAELTQAVSEVEEFAASAGWDAAPQIFALVRTADLIATEPSLTASLDGSGELTAIAQEQLITAESEGDPGDRLAAALAALSWPPEVAGCALVQEIVVLPSGIGEQLTAAQAAEHPDRREARLVAGVLRGRPGGACVLRLRTGDAEPLLSPDLAPNLLAALQATFDD